MALRLGSIVGALEGQIQCRLHGDADLVITALSPLDSAQAQHLSFLSHPRYQSQLAQSRAGCVVVSPVFEAMARSRGACIVTDDPYFCFARVTQLWRQHLPQPDQPPIHSSSVISPQAVIHPGARIGPFCVVESGAVIGAGTVLASHITVGHDCQVGDRCILHSGVVIGADGFGFAPHEGVWAKIEQLGAVRIGHDVEIGANTCIDRGALQDTVIEDGVKLDNLIQIGHNVHIGAHTALAGCVGVAGSTTIGAHCTLGGGAIVLGHLTLADHVHISAASVVTHAIHRAGHYTGMFPIDDNAAWEKNAASVKRLSGLRDRIRALEARIQKTSQATPSNH